MGGSWARPRDKGGRFMPLRARVTEGGMGEGAREESRLVAEPAGDEKVQPRGCRQYVQKQLAKVLPEVMSALVAKACSGDVQALKALWLMSGIDRRGREAAMEAGNPMSGGEKSVAQLLLERLKERER